MSKVLDLVDAEQFIPFHQLFNFDEGREGVVVSFIAILELMKES
jgi:segregation and condensation protein A